MVALGPHHSPSSPCVMLGKAPLPQEPSLAPVPLSHLPRCCILSEAGGCRAPGQFPSPHPGAEHLPGIAGGLRGGKWHFGESRGGRRSRRTL